MAKITREQYEQAVTLAYKGYTGEGIQAVNGKHPNSTSKMFGEMGLSFSIIRRKKRDGATLAQIMDGVDWSFLDKKEQTIAKKCEIMRQARSKTSSATNRDIAEIKAMLTEIYEALTSPKAAPSLMSKVANGVFRN